MNKSFRELVEDTINLSRKPVLSSSSSGSHLARSILGDDAHDYLIKSGFKLHGGLHTDYIRDTKIGGKTIRHQIRLDNGEAHVSPVSITDKEGNTHLEHGGHGNLFGGNEHINTKVNNLNVKDVIHNLDVHATIHHGQSHEALGVINREKSDSNRIKLTHDFLNREDATNQHTTGSDSHFSRLRSAISLLKDHPNADHNISNILSKHLHKIPHTPTHLRSILKDELKDHPKSHSFFR